MADLLVRGGTRDVDIADGMVVEDAPTAAPVLDATGLTVITSSPLLDPAAASRPARLEHHREVFAGRPGWQGP